MEKKESQHYCIRKSRFWGLIGGAVFLIGAAYFKDDLYREWLKSGGREDISFLEMESKLNDEEECYLCGSSDRSLMGYYRKFDAVGIISLNDWYILDLQIKNCDEEGSGSATRYGNTGAVSYIAHSSTSRGMSSMDITLPEDYNLNADMIREHLCQECLNKIAGSLDYSKWRYEKKEAVPLCLVDFQTLEIYSLQDWHRGCTIRDYWVEMEAEGNKIEIEAFYLPYEE